MTDTTMSLLPAALRIADKRGMKRPGDLDEFGLRACLPDFTSRNDFRWSFPGKWTKAAGPFSKFSDPCPTDEGDGICVALTWDGMASGGISAHLVLLVGWCKADVLARDRSKIRLRKAFVVDAMTVSSLLAERHEDELANLSGADLSYADLSYADLSYADLSYADLSGADLSGADLSYAKLSGADLSYADLSYADLSYADLSGADLSGARLSGARLSGARLSGARLSGADLSGAVGVPDKYKEQAAKS